MVFEATVTRVAGIMTMQLCVCGAAIRVKGEVRSCTRLTRGARQRDGKGQTVLKKLGEKLNKERVDAAVSVLGSE